MHPMRATTISSENSTLVIFFLSSNTSRTHWFIFVFLQPPSAPTSWLPNVVSDFPSSLSNDRVSLHILSPSVCLTLPVRLHIDLPSPQDPSSTGSLHTLDFHHPQPFSMSDRTCSTLVILTYLHHRTPPYHRLPPVGLPMQAQIFFCRHQIIKHRSICPALLYVRFYLHNILHTHG